MSIQQFISTDNSQVSIVIDGYFDFSSHQRFKDAYTNYQEPGTRFIVDLSKTSYMDSSALGMILLLKEHADKLSGTVILRKPNTNVSKVLEIAHFHHLVSIEE